MVLNPIKKEVWWKEDATRVVLKKKFLILLIIEKMSQEVTTDGEQLWCM